MKYGAIAIRGGNRGYPGASECGHRVACSSSPIEGRPTGESNLILRGIISYSWIASTRLAKDSLRQQC